MTTLFTRSLMKGIADGLSDGGAMAPFANDDFATGVFDKVAHDFGLPDILDGHLSNEVYIGVGQALLGAAKLAAENNIVPPTEVQLLAKQAAAEIALSDRALSAAVFYMDKAAEEASLNGTGINTPESAAATNAIARLDQANRSSLQYLVGMGNTDMPEGGVIGRQMAHPMAPQGPAIMNSLTNLDKMAAAEELAAEDAELTPEELAQLEYLESGHAKSASEKVERAIDFMGGLANRGAPITAKTVLAAAVLADTGAPGLDVMVNLIGNTKTAEELDEHLDEAVAAGDEHGIDPHLVEAIQEALENEAGEGEADHEEKAAADSKGFLAAMAAKKGKGKGKEAPPSVGSKKAPIPVPPNKKKSRNGFGAMPTAEAKEASLLNFLKAAADGSLNEVEENTPEDAAHYNANAELDMDNRSPDEYLEGAGESEMPNVGHRGASMAAPKGPARVNPDNTATRETKSAAFDYKVKAAAQFWGPKLPATMSQNEKRAHVIALAGMPADLQPGYVGSLYSR